MPAPSPLVDLGERGRARRFGHEDISVGDLRERIRAYEVSHVLITHPVPEKAANLPGARSARLRGGGAPWAA